MSTLYSGATQFESRLDNKKDIEIVIDGFTTVIELSYHGINRLASRAIYESAVVDMIQRGFDNIIELHRSERFILISKELGISIVGAVRGESDYILISVISVIDSPEPTNPHHTVEFII